MLAREPKLYRIIGDYKEIATFECYRRDLDFYMFNTVHVSDADIKQVSGKWQQSTFLVRDSTSKSPARALRWGVWYANAQQRHAEDAEPVGEAPIFEVCVIDPSQLIDSGNPGMYFCDSMTNVAVYRITFGGKEYSFYPDSYLTMMKNASQHAVEEKKDPIIEGIKSVFNNYSHPTFTLFLSCRRHHLALADEIRDNLPQDIEAARQYLLKKRRELIASDKGDTLNFLGGFMTRIDFAIAQITAYLVRAPEAEAPEREQLTGMRRGIC